MRKIYFVSLLVFGVFNSLVAASHLPLLHPMAENKYPVSAIPAALLEKANSVLRRHETVYTVKSAGEATEKVFYAITILNENGKNQAALQVFYDKLVKVNYIRGAIYDEQGNLLDKLSKSYIKDVSAYDGFSMMTDNRYKVAQFSRNVYPYTVEFEYEITDNKLLGYSAWNPLDELDMSIEKANFQIVMPKGLQLRYKELNISKKVTITSEESKQVYNWEVTNVTTKEKELLSPEGAMVPRVLASPSQFEVEGYAGDMTTWKSYGEWANKLNAGRDVLPEEFKQKLVQLVAGEKEPINKVKKIYDYLQSSTRYVSIQLGIGGWQPFEATSVNKNSYGDCKALSNYTKAMLKAIGIDSYYTLVLAGEEKEDIDVNFPSTQFNHAILFVPLQKDTVWLECTDQTKAFGYAGSFTGNRHALAITPEGGKIVRTPTYKATDNLQNRIAEVFLDVQGDATANVTSLYTGLQQDDVSAFVIERLSPEEQKKYLYKSIQIPNFDINKFEFSQKKNRIPSVTEKLQLTVRKCASRSGKRVFLPLNLMSAWDFVPAKNDARRTDLVLKTPSIDSDTIRYHLPEGYEVESQPENMAFQSKFGSYSASVKVDKGIVTYIRWHEMNKGQYPNTAFNEFADFCKKIAKADKMQLVLLSSPLAGK
ncbi:MAG: DUF3857 domain-containing protein [Bacteroidota bacterium]